MAIYRKDTMEQIPSSNAFFFPYGSYDTGLSQGWALTSLDSALISKQIIPAFPQSVYSWTRI